MRTHSHSLHAATTVCIVHEDLCMFPVYIYVSSQYIISKVIVNDDKKSFGSNCTDHILSNKMI